MSDVQAQDRPRIASYSTAGKYRVGDKVYFSDPDKRGLDGPYLISHARNGKYQLSLEDGTSVNEAKYVLEEELITAEV